MPPDQPNRPAKPAPVPARSPVPLNRRQRASTALRRALTALFSSWVVNGVGILEDPDPELLHQFRVALRRSRALLREVRGVFEPSTVASFRRELKWLTGLTGPIRDLDVLTSNLSRYSRGLSRRDRAALRLLRRELAEHRLECRQELLRALRSDRYRRLLSTWPAFLSKPPPRLGPLGLATIPTAATPAIERLHRQITKRLGKLESEASDDLFHRARIDCKRLRYLLDQFGDLYPAEPTRRVLHDLRKLQDALGEINDLRVHRDLLQRDLSARSPGTEGDGSMRRAVERVLDHLERHAEKCKERTLEWLAVFSSAQSRSSFEEAISRRRAKSRDG